MSDLLEMATSVIKRAEQEIQTLIETAAKKRLYNDLQHLAETAKHLALISIEPPEHGRQSCSKESGSVGGLAKDSNRLVRPKSDGQPAASQERTSRKEGDGPYPKFLRQGPDLVKVALSRNSQSTYRHRMPKEHLDTIVARALHLTNMGRGLFTAEALSDVRNQADQTKIPGYQLYMSLAWLKRSGFLKQHGRRGYALFAPNTVVEAVKDAWELLSDENNERDDGGASNE